MAEDENGGEVSFKEQTPRNRLLLVAGSKTVTWRLGEGLVVLTPLSLSCNSGRRAKRPILRPKFDQGCSNVPPITILPVPTHT